MSATEPTPSDADLVLPGRLERLRAELVDERVPALAGVCDEIAGLVELSYALRPPVHEGRAPTYGAILVAAPVDVADLDFTPLDLDLLDVADLDTGLVRRFADGLRTFAVRRPSGIGQLLCFGRAMTREYDLVILRSLLEAVIVQRHPSGQVRAYGPAGVVRWDGLAWYHEAPIGHLVDRLGPVVAHVPDDELRLLLLFVVHELSPRRIGATLVWRPDGAIPPSRGWEPRYPRVPPASLAHPGGPAAIASVLAQTDGAALFGPGCTLSAAGVQLVPSPEAKAAIDLVGGTRHTSALRYSFDDHDAVLLVVSEDGPVTIMHAGTSSSLSDEPGTNLIG